MSERAPLIGTPSQTVGPFFHFGLTQKPNGRLVDRLPAGQPISLVITVTDGDQKPVADAVLELCQSGVFGRMPTGEDGSCEFQTVLPDSPITVCLFARGLLRQLHTRIYFPGEASLIQDFAGNAGLIQDFAGNAGLIQDRVLALVPEHRRRTLMASVDSADASIWRFTVRLQGRDETVFFDM